MDRLLPSPHLLTLSASYVAVMMLLGVALTLRVALYRLRQRISLGEGDDPELRKRIRAHGNFTEQAPWIAFALLALALIDVREGLVHLVGITGVLGRILHALALSRGDTALPFRKIGMQLTLFSQVAGALGLLILAWR